MSPKVTVGSNTAAYAALRKRIREVTDKAVDIGLFESSGQDVVDRARFNEFGTEHIPSRPFLSTAFEVHAAEMVKTSQKALTAITKGKLTVSRGLRIIGLKGQAVVRKRIVEIQEPPNAPATIEKKGSSNPLIDTGEMLREIDFRVRK